MNQPFAKLLYATLVSGFFLLCLFLLISGAGLWFFAGLPHADYELEKAYWPVNTTIHENFVFFPYAKRLDTTRFTLIAEDEVSPANLVWGLWIQTDSAYLMVGITLEGSHGYVTARICPDVMADFEACPTLTEPNQKIQTGWKESIFLKPLERNEIYLHYEPNRGVLVLRLNREWMWDLPYQAPQGVEWGRWQRADFEMDENDLSGFWIEVWSDSKTISQRRGEIPPIRLNP